MRWHRSSLLRVVVAFSIGSMILFSPANLYGNCLEYAKVDDAKAKNYLSKLVLTTGAFIVLTGATAYAGYYTDYYDAVQRNMSFTDTYGHEHACKWRTGSWLCSSQNQTCYDFVDSCTRVRQKESYAAAGFGVGFFLDICAFIGSFISAEYYRKECTKNGEALLMRQQKLKTLDDVCCKQINLASSTGALVGLYEKLITKNQKTKLTILDVYLHVHRGVETDALCPNKKPLDDDQVVTWMLDQEAITASSYEQFSASMNNTEKSHKLVQLHRDFNHKALELSHAMYPGDESIDGVPVRQSAEKVHKKIEQCLNDIHEAWQSE